MAGTAGGWFMESRQAKGLQAGRLYKDSASSVALTEEASPEAVTKGFLCVADSASLRDYLPQLTNGGWKGVLVSGTDSVPEALRENGEIRVALIGLDTDNGEAVAELVSNYCDLEWIAVVEQHDLESMWIKQIISSLFFDYHTLPIDVDRLLVTLGHADGMAKLRTAGSRYISYAGDDEAHYHDIVGISEGMRSVYSTIEKAAPTHFPILITGNSGTGKELVAKAIHHKSERSDRPLVTLNCGGVVPSLIQSELFGHEKGSFTSADNRRQGQFEAANGGTIFLDEIGELPLETQANLLRVLEEDQVRRVGGSSNIPIDVRVIAATNRNLPQAVANGEFREDLLYRLSVVKIEIPPLRERQSDIEILANYYLRKLKLETRSTARGFSRKAIEAMMLHDWPGNVRELINRIKSAALLSETQLIKPRDLGLASPNGSAENCKNMSSGSSLRAAKDEAERRVVTQALQQVNFNVSLAAQKLGVSRVTLYNLLKKHELR